MRTRQGVVFLQSAPCPSRTTLNNNCLPGPPESSLEATFCPKYQGHPPHEILQVPGPALAGGWGQPWAGNGREPLCAWLSLPGYPLFTQHGCLLTATPHCATHSCRLLL